MPLPQLPLKDGCLFLDNSFLERLTTCARSAEYDFLWKKRATEHASALAFGGAIHKALEHRYKSPVRETADEECAILTELFSTYDIADDDFRTLGLAQQLIRQYHEVYPREQFSILLNSNTNLPLVEQSFAVELCRIAVPTEIHPSGVVIIIWTGRIDLLIDQNGQLFTLDHKTSSVFGSSFWETQAMSAQHKGYVWATREVFKQMPAGYVINAIRTRKPYRETKDGKVPLKKEQVADDDFLRQTFYLTEADIDEWRNDTIALCEEFLWKYRRGYFPKETMWCVGKYSRCQYYDVCSLPADNREAMLNSGMFVENTWSPLEHVKGTK